MLGKKGIEDWQSLAGSSSEGVSHFDRRLEKAVRGALSRLSETEKEIVERFFLCGEKTAAIGAGLKLPAYHVESILKQSRRKLKEQLARFVARRYGLPAPAAPCRICLSKDRKAIEEILKTKTKEETWRRILRSLRIEFQLATNARSLERHRNCHQRVTNKDPGGNTI